MNMLHEKGGRGGGVNIRYCIRGGVGGIQGVEFS